MPGDHVALPEPGCGDHRRAGRRGQGSDLGVGALDAGVAVRGALLGITVHFADRVVHIDERHRLGPGPQPRRESCEAGQGPGGDRVELADVPEGEAAQECAQRRGRLHPCKDLGHPAVAQHVQVIDAVRAGQHPRDHARRLGCRVRRAHAQPFLEQLVQASAFGQPHHRDQPGRADQVRVIENRGYLM